MSNHLLKGPYLQWPTTRSVIVMWETADDEMGAVEVYDTERVHSGFSGRGAVRKESRRVFEASESSRIHRVVVSGLQPDTEYAYRVVGSEDMHVLYAAPPPERPFSFCVTSETGGYGDDDINVALFAQMQRWRPDMLLVVGDAVRDGRNYDDWQRYLFGPGREFLTSTPFYLCPGNHEENADWFYRYTAFPPPGNYYGFDYGNTHFTALDSTRLVETVDGAPQPTAELEPLSEQRRFLRDDLAGATEATWRITMFHYPPYVSGDFEVTQMRTLCPDLEEGNVDLVFNSHTIVYERSHPLRRGTVSDNGLVYVVAGGAGAKPDWFRPKKAAHTACALAVPHFVHVSVAGRRLEAKAIDVDGHVFDTWSLQK